MDAAGRPRVLIDALNLAYWCGSPPSLRIPLGLLAALLARGDDAQLGFDASTRHRLPVAATTAQAAPDAGGERAIYAALLAHPGCALEVAAGRRADAWLLREAARRGGVVVSRDHFRDHRRRHRRLIDDPARRLSGEVRDDRILIAALDLDAPLPASAAHAWTMLLAVLRPATPALEGWQRA